MPSGRSPAARTASTTRATIDSRAATTTIRSRAAPSVVIEHDLVERHRDRLGRLEADGHRELLGVVDLRQLEVAHDDLLVGDAEADAAGKVVRLEEVAQRFGERVDVRDLAVGDHAGRQLGADRAGDAVGTDLDSGDELAVEV